MYIKVQNWPFPTTLLAKLDCMDKCNYIQKDLHDSYVFNQDKIQHPLLSKEDKDVDKNIYSPGYNFLYIYIHTHTSILAFAITLEYLSNQFSLSAFTLMHPRFPFPLWETVHNIEILLREGDTGFYLSLSLCLYLYLSLSLIGLLRIVDTSRVSV